MIPTLIPITTRRLSFSLPTRFSTIDIRISTTETITIVSSIYGNRASAD